MDTPTGRQDRNLVSAMLELLSSACALFDDDLHDAALAARLDDRSRTRLKDIARGLNGLRIAAALTALLLRSGEHRAIRSGRSVNIGEDREKALLLLENEEHAMVIEPSEVLLSDLLLFPPVTVPEASQPSSSAFPWPRLATIGLDRERLDARNRGIGGSDANIILSGDDERLTRLWREKRGESPPEDLSGRLSVALGSWTEDFNRQWYEKLSGNRVVDAGKALTCATYRWRKCTLDGRVDGSGAIFEAKHTNSFVKADEVLERYMPQLQHNMAVAGADRAVLSVIFGNAKYEMFEVAADWLYQLDLFKAEQAFWSAVLSGEPPVAMEAPPAPRPVATRELSFEGNNAWASAAADWLENGKAAKTHASACKTLKELLDDDVLRAFGHGIEAKRSKAGAISIRELK